LDVIDPVRGRDRPLERRRDKSANELSVRSDVDGRDLNRCDIAPRILANVDCLHRLQSGDENDEAHDHRQNWPFDEKVGERFHVDLSSGIDRLRIQLRFRRELVVDRHRHSIAQFEHARADKCFAAF